MAPRGHPLCILLHREHGDIFNVLKDGTVALGTLLQRCQVLLDINWGKADCPSTQPMPGLEQLTRRAQMAPIDCTGSIIVWNVVMGMRALYSIVCDFLEVLPPASVDLALFSSMKLQTVGLTAAVLVMVSHRLQVLLLDHSWHALRTLVTCLLGRYIRCHLATHYGCDRCCLAGCNLRENQSRDRIRVCR